MKPATTVNLSPLRVPAQCVLAIVLIWTVLPTSAIAADPYSNSAIAALAASTQSNITRRDPAPSITFARKSGKGGGGSGDSGKDDDNEDKKDKADKKDKDDKEDKKDSDDRDDKEDKEDSDDRDDKEDKKDSDDRDDKEDKEDRDDKDDKEDKEDRDDKDDKEDKEDRDDKDDKEDRDDDEEDRDDAGGSDEQESDEDQHDHDRNERHDHDNGAADDRHDHETEEERHDHNDDQHGEDNADAGEQEPHDEGDAEQEPHDEGDAEQEPHDEGDAGQEHDDEGDPAAEDGPGEAPPASGTQPTLELSGIPPDAVTAGDLYVFRPDIKSDSESTPVFSIDGLPRWASFDDITGELSGTPQEADVGVYEAITISASVGETESSLPSFSIAVSSATGSITLSWSPPSENEDGSPLVDLSGYWIYWRESNATDTESMKIDNPGLSTIVIDNLVAGTYEFAMTSFNTDGIESVRSNTITRIVEAGSGAADEAGDVATNDAPGDTSDTADTMPFLVLSGTPPEAVTVGDLYLFTPGVESGGEAPPVFLIDGLPHWAGFDEITGELYGTPDEAHVGLYDAITISATDGVVETSLPTFSIEVVAPGAAMGVVTLSWMPPIENEDGSYLVDLAGYWIYWGNNPGQYTEWMRIDNPGLTTVVIESLVPGTWEFAMTSFNSAGVESALSNVVTRFVD